jgi:hypothetical protein
MVALIAGCVTGLGLAAKRSRHAVTNESAVSACPSAGFRLSLTGALAGEQPCDGEPDKGCAVDRRRKGASMQQPAGRNARRRSFERCEPPNAPLCEDRSQAGKHAHRQWVSDREQRGGRPRWNRGHSLHRLASEAVRVRGAGDRS